MSEDAAPEPMIRVTWTGSGHIRLRATRGAVTTEATLTVMEAQQLAVGLSLLLSGGAPPVAELLTPAPRDSH